MFHLQIPMFRVGFICPVPKMHEADFCQPQIPLWFSPWDWVPHPKSSFQNTNSSSSSLWLLSLVWIPWPCRREKGIWIQCKKLGLLSLITTYNTNSFASDIFYHFCPKQTIWISWVGPYFFFFIIFPSNLRLTFYHNLFLKKNSFFFFFALILKV